MKINKKTSMVLIACVAIVGVTIWFLLWYDKKAKNENGTSNQTNTGSSSGATTSEFPLKIGSRGEKVRELQQKLNTAVEKKWDILYVKPTFAGEVINSLVVDGVFGAKTLTFLQYVFVDQSKMEISETEFNKLK